MKIHLFGASGSGVTTTGKALAEASGFPYFDADSYYWLPTEPPFRRKRPPRNATGCCGLTCPVTQTEFSAARQ